MTTDISSPMNFMITLEAAAADITRNEAAYKECTNAQKSEACRGAALLVKKLTLGGVLVLPPPDETAAYLALMLLPEKELLTNPKFKLRLDVKPVYIIDTTTKTKRLADTNFILPLGPFGSKKDHIMRLSFENEYYNKFSEKQKNWVAKKLVEDRVALFENIMSKDEARRVLEQDKNRPDWNKMGICTRVNWLYDYAEGKSFPQDYKSKQPRFPQAKLTAALKLIDLTDEEIKKKST